MMRLVRRQTWLLIAAASEHVEPGELGSEEMGTALQLVTMPEGETWSQWLPMVSVTHNGVTIQWQWLGWQDTVSNRLNTDTGS